MKIELILDNLRLDLSQYEFTFIEENNWLKDNTISKYTYPGEVELTNEQSVALGNILEENLNSYETLLNGLFYVFGEEHEAVMDIQQLVGRRLVFQIRYGLEEFPNFGKKLSALPLEKFDLTESVYTHAKNTITQTYPLVNYNFPQVITNRIDTDQEQWALFLGIINNYDGTDFLINEFDAVDNIQINRNILLPMPYLIYVLKKGFEDVGITLEGEILTDPEYLQATIYQLSEFYTKFTTISSEHLINTDEYSSIEEVGVDPSTGIVTYGNYSETINLSQPGRYKIAGNVNLRMDEAIFADAKFTYNGEVLWQGTLFSLSRNYKSDFRSVDFNFDFSGVEGPVTFESYQLSYSRNGNEIIEDAQIMSVTLTQLAKYDSNGALVSTLVEPTAIDLSKSVPEMTFGEFATALMKKRNYGYDINGDTITINKRKVSNVDKSNGIDLQPFEVMTPERNFNQGKSYILKEFEFSIEDYKSKTILIDNNGFNLEPSDIPQDAEETTINCFALPLKLQTVMTAYDFLNIDDKLILVLYNGVDGSGLNLANDAESISLVNNYINSYSEWYNFLLNSINYQWIFESSYENISELKVRSIIYAYKQFHVIRRISRQSFLTKNNGIFFEVDISTETLK